MSTVYVPRPKHVKKSIKKVVSKTSVVLSMLNSFTLVFKFSKEYLHLSYLLVKWTYLNASSVSCGGITCFMFQCHVDTVFPCCCFIDDCCLYQQMFFSLHTKWGGTLSMLFSLVNGTFLVKCENTRNPIWIIRIRRSFS